jgi:hypothetical protein
MPAPALTAEALVILGSRFSGPGLLSAAEATVALVNKNAALFARFKVDAAWKKNVAALSAKVTTALKNSAIAAADVTPAAADLDDAIAAAKAWRNDCMTFADLAFAGGAEHTKFHAASGRAGTHAALVKSLRALLPLATKYVVALKAEGASAKFATEGSAAADALASAMKAHTAAMNDRTPASQALDATKGALYVALKRASSVARRQGVKGTRVGVAKLARAKRGKRKGAKTGAGATAPSAPAKTTSGK